MANALGKEVKHPVGHMDAHHVACVIVHGEGLTPGDPCRFIDKKTVKPCEWNERHAIADPFAAQLDEEFWVLVMPDRIQNLTHSFNLEIEEEEEDRHDYGDYDHSGDCEWKNC